MILGAASRITCTRSIIFDRWINDFEKWTRAVVTIFSPNVLIYVHELRHEFASRAISNDFEQFRFSKNILKKKRKGREKTKTKFPTLNEKNIEMYQREKLLFFLIERRNYLINLISFRSKNFKEENKKNRFEIRILVYLHLWCCYSCKDKCITESWK